MTIVKLRFQGIPGLKASIVEVALQQKYMGEKIPEAWLNLEKKLIKLREEQNKDFLLFKQLEAISAGVGIFDKNEVRTNCCQKCGSMDPRGLL